MDFEKPPLSSEPELNELPENEYSRAELIPSDYEAILDPDHTLPGVRLEEIPNAAKGTLRNQSYTITDKDGNTLGELALTISYSKKREASAYINKIVLQEDQRGKGYARAVYLQILESLAAQGVRLQSGWQLSRGSVPIWEWLVESGIARKVSEGEINEDTENAAYSSAEYEII